MEGDDDPILLKRFRRKGERRSVDGVKRKRRIIDPYFQAVNIMLEAKGKVMVFTGAGVSQESGIPTYRDPGGIWESFDKKKVGHIKGFVSNPLMCWRFEFELHKLLKQCGPNKGHRALAALEELEVIQGIITQNVDSLHQDAGSVNVHELHGNEMRGVCLKEDCGKKFHATEVFKKLKWMDDEGCILEQNVPPCPGKPSKSEKAAEEESNDDDDDSDSGSDSETSSSSSDATSISSSVSSTSSGSSEQIDYERIFAQPSKQTAVSEAPKCACGGIIKPDAIYFGEPLDSSVRRACKQLSKDSRVVVVVGSSCVVSPANKLPLLVKASGGKIIEVNVKETIMTRHSCLNLRHTSGNALSDLLVTTVALISADAAVLAIVAVSLISSYSDEEE